MIATGTSPKICTIDLCYAIHIKWRQMSKEAVAIATAFTQWKWTLSSNVQQKPSFHFKTVCTDKSPFCGASVGLCFQLQLTLPMDGF